MSSTNSPLFSIICTIALGGAILYLLQRLRRTDSQLRELHTHTRQIIDVGQIKTIVRSILEKKQHAALPKNFNQLVEDIASNKVKQINQKVQNERTARSFQIKKEENTTIQEKNEEEAPANTATTALSFDEEETDGGEQNSGQSYGVPVSRSIQRLAETYQKEEGEQKTAVTADSN